MAQSGHVGGWYRADRARRPGVLDEPAVLRKFFQLARVGGRAVRVDSHVKCQRLVPVQSDFYPMGAGIDLQSLEDTVEIIDSARKITIDVYRRFSRLHFESQRTLVSVTTARVYRRGRVVQSRVIKAVITAEADATVRPRIVPGHDHDSTAIRGWRTRDRATDRCAAVA